VIRVLHWAKSNNIKQIELLGTGKSLRQLTFVDDLSKCIKSLIDKNAVGCFNVASPHNVSIKNITQVVTKIVGYEGEIIFNGKCEGQFRKDLDCKKLHQVIGPFEFYNIDTGIAQTYKWYKENLSVEIDD
jgi:GDP-L-fucose synthase